MTDRWGRIGVEEVEREGKPWMDHVQYSEATGGVEWDGTDRHCPPGYGGTVTWSDPRDSFLCVTRYSLLRTSRPS